MFLGVVMETIDILIPVYNCEKFIEKCLDSLLSQTYKIKAQFWLKITRKSIKILRFITKIMKIAFLKQETIC